MKAWKVSRREMERIHPAIPDAYDKLEQGRISRREFMRFATLLGMSAATATIAAACAAPSGNGQAAATTAVAGAQQATAATSPAGPRRGGRITKAMQLQLLDHPARLSWTEGANVVRQICEYLTETRGDNVTRPYLLERWEASDDVKTWDLYLKQGVTFNNGDPLTADDVIFTFGQWLNKDVGSSMYALLSYIGGPQNIEKVDDHHIRLHLETGNIGVPEHLFEYPALVLHRSFGGDIVQQPLGTGAFTLQEYAEGERAVLRRRPDYWRNGVDGQPLP